MKSLANFLQEISNLEIVMLAYDDPRIKVKMMQAIVLECLCSKQQVHYIDLDLQFSSMLRNLPIAEQQKIHNFDFNLLKPSQEVRYFLGPSKFIRKGGVIVIDTLNTIQSLFMSQPETDSKIANHKTAIMISTIQQMARSYSKPMIILNLTKSRPRQSTNVTWERDLVGGRMTRFKSDVIMFAIEARNTIDERAQINIVARTVCSEQFRGMINDVYEIFLD